MKKAFEASLKTGLVSLADDTGLFIKALNDKPGVYQLALQVNTVPIKITE
jgi:inosine/xanthosine triphosphate pyrophosphatase family protein